MTRIMPYMAVRTDDMVAKAREKPLIVRRAQA
jgi:hypothetical protein